MFVFESYRISFVSLNLDKQHSRFNMKLYNVTVSKTKSTKYFCNDFFKEKPLKKISLVVVKCYSLRK